MQGGHRLLRRKFLPLFCSGVVRLAHRKCEVMAQYHVRSAHEIFKVQSSPEKKNTAHAVQAKDFVG